MKGTHSAEFVEDDDSSVHAGLVDLISSVGITFWMLRLTVELLSPTEFLKRVGFQNCSAR
jgi:hypothetical protein